MLPVETSMSVTKQDTLKYTDLISNYTRFHTLKAKGRQLKNGLKSKAKKYERNEMLICKVRGTTSKMEMRLIKGSISKKINKWQSKSVS